VLAEPVLKVKKSSRAKRHLLYGVNPQGDLCQYIELHILEKLFIGPVIPVHQNKS